MERELEILVQMRDQASRQVETINKSLGQTEKSGERADKATKSLGSGLVGLGRTALKAATSFKALAVSVAAFVGVRAAINSLKSINAEVDRLAKLSARSKVSTEFLSSVATAAEFAGVSTDQFASGVERLSRTIGLAAQGQAEYLKQFEMLGVEIRDAQGNVRPTEEVFADVSDAIAGLGSASEQAAAASKIFGEEAGPRLLNLLTQGAAGIKSARQEAEFFGVVIGPELAANAQALSDAMFRMGLAIKGVAFEILREFGDDMASGMNSLAKSIAEARIQAVRLYRILANILFNFRSQEVQDFFGSISTYIKTTLADWGIVIRDWMLRTIRDLGAQLGSLLGPVFGAPFTQAAENAGAVLESAGYQAGMKWGRAIIQGARDTAGDNALRALGILAETNPFGQTLTGPSAPQDTDSGGTGGSGSSPQVDALAAAQQLVAQNQVLAQSFQLVQQAGATALEGFIDGSLTASEAVKQFAQSFISSLVSMVAQLLIAIPIAILFNTLTGGTLALSGAAATAAALSSAGGLVSSILGGYAASAPSSAGGGAPQTSTQSASVSAPLVSQSAAGSPNGNTTIYNINAIDTQSFDQALRGRRKTISEIGAKNANMDLGTRRAYGLA